MHTRSKRHKANALKVDNERQYTVEEAIAILAQFNWGYTTFLVTRLELEVTAEVGGRAHRAVVPYDFVEVMSMYLR